MSYKNDLTGKRVSLHEAVRAITEDEEAYLSLLADELLLEEILCGEANPVEFLKNSIKVVLERIDLAREERRLQERKDRIAEVYYD